LTMTWVIGYSSPLAYAVGMSDIRVTFRGNRTKDCLQKIHPISPFICLGFAGSVRIGFSLVERLRYELRDAPPGSAWDQYEVAKWCPEVFQEVFASHTAEERNSQSHLIMLAAHPCEPVDDPTWAKCSVFIFRSPRFSLEEAPLLTVVSIGSGAGVEVYRSVLQKHTDDRESLMKLEPMGLGMGSFGLEMSISDILRAHPISGVSPHVQICIVRRSEYFLSDNNLIHYAPDGAEIPSSMPPVATSFAEFERMAAAEGVSPVCAVC
jgi:hypothetical protein